jgi:hypothetical protein
MVLTLHTYNSHAAQHEARRPLSLAPDQHGNAPALLAESIDYQGAHVYTSGRPNLERAYRKLTPICAGSNKPVPHLCHVPLVPGSLVPAKQSLPGSIFLHTDPTWRR